MQSGIPINETYCGREDINIHLAGQIPILGTPILEYDNAQLTAITASQVHDVTVGFLGTSAGQLKKVKFFNEVVVTEPDLTVEFKIRLD